MTHVTDFWDRLAPHHDAIENSYLDLASIRRILDALHPPILVVGAGQGLIVEELHKRGLHCDGLDWSPEMVRYAKLRRGLTLVEGDARAMPFEDGRYGTVIYATGVIDFMGDEDQIRAILNQGRRVVSPAGKIFVAFYKISRGLEDFMARIGLLKNGVVAHRQSLEIYLLNPVQMVAWVASRAGISTFRAATLLLRLSTLTTFHEKAITFQMQRIFRNRDIARGLIESAPEKQPYRNEPAVKHLFERLGIPIRQFQTTRSCHLVQI